MKTYASPSKSSEKSSALSSRSNVSKTESCSIVAAQEPVLTEAQPKQNIGAEQFWGMITENVMQPSTTGNLIGNSGLVIQRKMTVGEVGDRYEEEADRLALQIVNRLNTPAFEKGSTVVPSEGDFPPTIQLQALRPTLHLPNKANGEVTITPTLEAAIVQAKNHGQPLDFDSQQRFGQAMGVDFSRVRIHTDHLADRLNQALNARAFTTGHHIFIKHGNYQSKSNNAQQLLAHELTHVVQQCGQSQSTLAPDSNLSRKSISSRYTAPSGSTLLSPPATAHTVQRLPSLSWPASLSWPSAAPVKAFGKATARSVGGIVASPIVSAYDAYERRGQDSETTFGSRFKKYLYGKDDADQDISEELKKAYGGKRLAGTARTLQILGELCDTVFKWSGSVAALAGLFSIGFPAAAPVSALATAIAGYALFAKSGLNALLQAWTAERANYLYSKIRAIHERDKDLQSSEAKDLIVSYILTLGEDKANKIEYGQTLATALTMLATSGISAATSGSGYVSTTLENYGLVSPESLNAAAHATERADALATGVGVGVDTVLDLAQEHDSTGIIPKLQGSQYPQIEKGNLKGSVKESDENNISDLADLLKKLPPPKHKSWGKKKAHLLNPFNWIIWGLKKILNFAEVIRNSFRSGPDHKEQVENAWMKVGSNPSDNSKEGNAYKLVEGIKTQFGDKTKLGRKFLKSVGGLFSGVIGAGLGAGTGAVGGLLTGAIRGGKKGFEFWKNPALGDWNTLDRKQKFERVGRGFLNGITGLVGAGIGAVGGTVLGTGLGLVGGAKGGWKAGRGAAKAGQTSAEGIWQLLGQLPTDGITKRYGVGAIAQGLGNLTRGVLSAGAGTLGFLGQAATAGIASGVGAGIGSGETVYDNSSVSASSVSSPGSSSSHWFFKKLDKAKGYLIEAEEATKSLNNVSPHSGIP